VEARLGTEPLRVSAGVSRRSVASA